MTESGNDDLWANTRPDGAPQSDPFVPPDPDATPPAGTTPPPGAVQPGGPVLPGDAVPPGGDILCLSHPRMIFG